MSKYGNKWKVTVTFKDGAQHGATNVTPLAIHAVENVLKDHKFLRTKAEKIPIQTITVEDQGEATDEEVKEAYPSQGDPNRIMNQSYKGE